MQPKFGHARYIRNPKDGLKWLKPIFKHAAQIIEEYAQNEQEPAYWCNETASVSIFIAAAARSRYVALSDYKTEKKKKAKKKMGYGRCDLYLAKRKKPYPYLEIEAKQMYLGPARRHERVNTRVNGVEDRLDAACGDAELLKKNGRGHRAGMLFAISSVPKKQYLLDGSVERGFYQDVKKVASRLKPDICWVWSAVQKPGIKPNWYYWKRSRHYLPAMAVFLRLVD